MQVLNTTKGVSLISKHQEIGYKTKKQSRFKEPALEFHIRRPIGSQVEIKYKNWKKNRCVKV